MGMVRTFQHTRVLPFLSTRENLLSAVPAQRGERLTSLFFRPSEVRREEKRNRARADEVLDLIKLASLADELSGRLSYGQQKLLELGRVLMAEPKMILLDEPTAGINPL
jgi:branched-chain amino acid transport system ATP-binding protein